MSELTKQRTKVGTSPRSYDRVNPRFVSLTVLIALWWLTGPSRCAEANPPAAPNHAGAGRSPDIIITIVYDNYAFDERLETAWGFSCVVEGFPKTILFDTGGNGELLLRNMKKLGFHPRQIDAVVLSHIHADHTGGLEAFLEANSNVEVFLPKVFPSSFIQDAQRLGAAVVETEGPCQVCEGASTTGVLGTSIPEQGLYLKTDKGLVVITGCAHPGIVKMTEAAQHHADAPPYAVIGGFHMASASIHKIRRVVTRFSEMGIQKVGPCHCSGDETRRLMKETFSDGYLAAGAGFRLTFQKEIENRKVTSSFTQRGYNEMGKMFFPGTPDEPTE